MDRRELKKRFSILMTVVLTTLIIPDSFYSSPYMAEDNGGQYHSSVLPDGEVGRDFQYTDEATESDYENSSVLSEATLSVASPSIVINDRVNRKITIDAWNLNGAEVRYCLTGYGTRPSESDIANGTLYTGGIIDLKSFKEMPFTISAWVANHGTPTNIYCSSRLFYYMPGVSASLPEGHVEKGSPVTLSVKGGLSGYTVYYTTDGSDPTAASQRYAGPIRIDEDMVLKAIALPDDAGRTADKGWITGGIETFSYYTGNCIEDRYEPDNSPENAAEISFPGKYDAMISYNGDLDYYHFSLTENTSLNLMLTPPAGADYGMKLYRVDENTGKNMEIASGDSSIIATDSDAGSYYAEVFGKNGSFTDHGTYSLRLYPKYNEVTDTVDFSEKNIVTSLFGSEAGDQAVYTGSRGRSVGGAFIFDSIYYFADGYGPVDETLDPYWQEAGHETDSAFRDYSSTAAYHLENVILGPSQGDVDRGSLTVEELRSHLKNLVYTYGAVSIDMNLYVPYFDEYFSNYYNRNNEYAVSPQGVQTGAGHEITLVGWDDNYDKNNFGTDTAFLRSYGFATPSEALRPSENGAWICKNSWGDQAGENGYFYISYDSTEIFGSSSAVFMMERNTEDYNRQYLNAAGNANFYCITKGTGKAENTFTTDSHPQLLKAVSEISLTQNMHYSFYLTVNGEKTKILEGSEYYPGYYTHRLEKPVLLPPDTDFTITEVMYAEDGNFLRVPLGFADQKIPGRCIFYESDDGSVNDYSGMGYYQELRVFTSIPGETGHSLVSLTAHGDGVSGSKSAGTGLTAAGAELKAAEPERTADENEEERFPYALGAVIEKPVFGISGGIAASDLPSAFDLRNRNAVTKVRDQGSYGACWAFAACASAESSVLMNGGVKLDYNRSMSVTGNSGSSIRLTEAEPEKTVELKATIALKNGDGGEVYWYVTGDTDSVEVLHTKSVSGENVPVFKFIKPGTVTVTASAGIDINAAWTGTFTAEEEGIAGITLNRDSLALRPGETFKLQASVVPESAWNKTVSWESSNWEVTYVDRYGEVTALKEGRAVITARGSDVSAQCTVTVAESGSDGGSGSKNQDRGTDYTDPVKGYMNTLTGILTGSGSGFSKWISITDPETGAVTWKLQYANGTNAAGTWEKVDGHWYKFDAGGTMQTGWILDITDGTGKWYYLDPETGAMVMGLIHAPDGFRYYFREDGSMAVGDVEIDGVTHHFNDQLPPGPTYDKDPVTEEWKPNGSNAIPYGAEI